MAIADVDECCAIAPGELRRTTHAPGPLDVFEDAGLLVRFHALGERHGITLLPTADKADSDPPTTAVTAK